MKSRKTIIILCAFITVVVVIAVVVFLNGKNSESYNVIFYGDDGRILEKETVRRKDSAVAPIEPEMEYGSIFVKWKEDFSSVKADMDIYPEVYKTQGNKNLLAMPGAYGRNGEYVVIPLQLCGAVNLAAFDIMVEYDTESIKLESVFNEDGAVIYNDSVPGKISLNYVSNDNTISDVDICFFKFLIVGEKGETEVSLTVESAYTVEGDSTAKTECDVLNSKVFCY